MKKLITILLLLSSFFAVAQPGGYVPGTFVNYNFNGRDHGFGYSDRFNDVHDSLKRFVIHWCGIGETSFSNAYDQAPGKFLNDGGTNWNMKVVRANGDTIQFMIVTMFNYGGYYLPPHVQDVEYLFANLSNMPDTSHHERFWATGFSFGPGLMWGTFLESDFDYDQIFGGTRSISPTSLGVDVTTVSAGKRNDAWRDSLDNNGGTPYSAVVNLFNDLSGYKSIHTPNVGAAGHSADSALSIYGTGTAALTDSSKSFWRLVAEFNFGGLPNQLPIANAGTNQSITVPTSSVTLNGSGSTDPNGNIVSYAWSKVSGPSTYTITSPSSVSTSVTGLVQGVYVFRLTVTDDSSTTAFDDVQVAVVPAYTTPARFYISREVPFQLRGPGDMMVPKNLLDDDTATKYDVGFQSELIYQPFMANFILDSNVTNFRLRAFVGSGGHSASFKFYNNDFSDSTIVSFTNSGNLQWEWLDTTTTKSIAFPIRSFIMTTQTSNNDFRDFEFYGNTSNTTVTEYWPNYTGVPKTTVADNMMLGINGDEPATLIAKFTKQAINGTKVWYFDTAVAGITPTTHKFHFNVFGNDVLGAYQAYTSLGIKMYTYTLGASAANFYTGPKAPYTGGGSPYNYYSIKAGDTRNILPGADSLNPASYIADAKLAAVFATFFGSNPSASTAGLTATFSGGATAVVGPGNATRALSMKNEQDADWDSLGRARYTEPQAVIASLSPSYDSAYVRDSTFEIWDGALARPHTDVIKSKSYWSLRYRGFNKYPAKAISVNWYATISGGQGSSGPGASPEFDRTMYRIAEWVAVKNKYVGSAKFVVQEFGWDAAPSSIYAAATIGSKSRREVAADWAMRYFLLARAGGADKTTVFRSLDLTNDLNDGGSFITSGLATGWNGVHPDSSYAIWPLGYAMATLLNNTEKYIGKPDTLRNGGTTSYYIFKDSAVTGHDTACYYTWMGTSNGSSQSVTINAPSGKTFSSITVVTPRFTDGTSLLNTGSLTGVRSTLTPGNSFTVTATETPIMILVKETSTGVVAPVVRSRKFRRIR